MKILSIISLLTTILNPFITNANGSYSNIVQASYSYGIGYFDVGTSGGESIDSQYYIDIDINIQGTYSGYIYINATSPSSTMSSTYYPKYISVGGNYVGSGYSGAGVTSFCFKITSSSHLYVRLYYGLGTLHTYYGLVDNANQNLNWTNSGNQYVDITSVFVSSFTKDTDLITYIDDIESAITTLQSYTDSVENYLLQIWNTSSNIYSTLTAMSTNIVDIKNLLSSISSKMDTLTTISFNNISSTWTGYTTDLTNYNTNDNSWFDSGYFVWVNNITNEQKKGIFKIVIPIRNVSMENLRFYQIWSGVLQEFTIESYILFYNRENTTIYFILNDHYSNPPNGNYRMAIQCDKRTFLYNANDFYLGYMTQDNPNYWTLYNTINNFMNMRNINNSLNEIISILGDSSISQTDQQNKNTVDNFFDQVLQNLNLPSFPDKDSEPMFPILKEFIGIYGQIVGNQHMSMYRWLLSLSSVFLILKVILL